MNKLKKIATGFIASALLFTSSNMSVFANEIEDIENLLPGEVTQKKSAKWADYEKGIAEITFDVVGKSAEQPVDVAIIYDNSGSMLQTDKQQQGYLNSRWHYATTAAKTFTTELLQNKSNNVALIPFSDTLIDGSSKHTEIEDFFESHELFYDEQGNPDIPLLNAISSLYDAYLLKQIDLAEFYNIAEQYYGIKQEQFKEADNTKNALVPLTNNPQTIINAIDSLYPSRSGQTNYEIALKKAQAFLGNSNSEKVIVMISDGKPNVGGDSIQVAKALKDSGVTIYTCGAGLQPNEEGVLKAIASVDNNAPLYTSSKPADLSKSLATIRKKIGVAATDGVIKDIINADYFEYYIDETFVPTVNDMKITDENLIVADDKGSITWNIGDISETTKTLKFYVKIKDTLLNETLLQNDESLLNKAGSYKTNKHATLFYKDIHTGEMVYQGHEMKSPQIDITTATISETDYLSDGYGNIIKENDKDVLLDSKTNNLKALHTNYTIAPRQSIVVDNKTYFILKEDNKTINKTFTVAGQETAVSYRYIEQLHVTFDNNGVGQFADASTSRTLPVDHTMMTIPSLPTITSIPTNMFFTGWNTKKDGSGTTFTNTSEVKEDITVYAQFAYFPLTVTFQDKDKNVYSTETVAYGKAATAPTVTDITGYTFAGWDKDFSKVITDMTITSKFNANAYTVKFDGNGATTDTMNNQPFVYDQAQALNENTYAKKNHTFLGWIYNNQTYTNKEVVKNLTSTANGEITLMASWLEDEKFNVDFIDSEGNIIKTDIVYKNEAATAPANPLKLGYTFTNWDKDFSNITSDLAVTAQFSANPYTVIFDGNGATTGTMDNQAFVYDQAQALNENTYTKANHTFVGWTYNNQTYTDKEVVKNLTSALNGEVTLTAKWLEHDKYTVTFVDGFGNTIATDSVYIGQDAIAPANPTHTGYTFISWDKTFTNITSDLTVTAQFSANPYTVIFDGNGATAGTMDNQSFIYDQEQALTSNTYTRTNYTFVGWSYEDKIFTNEEVVKNLTSIANNEITLVAMWVENDRYTVTFVDGFGNTIATDLVYTGQDATAPANPTLAGYTFNGWDIDYTNVTKDLTVIALWSANEAILPPVTPNIPTLPTIPAVPAIVTPTLPTPPATPTPPTETVTPNETPKADGTETVEKQETPKAKGTTDSWALINLLSVIGTVLLVVAILLGKRKKEDEEDETVTYKRRKWTSIASLAIAVASIVLFIYTEDMSLPMILTDKWTLLMVAIFAVQLAVLVINKKWKKNDNTATYQA